MAAAAALVCASGLALAAPAAAAAGAGLPGNCAQSADGTVTCTFGYTGAEQTFSVPDGVSSLSVTATGASGGNSVPGFGRGGVGGVATETLDVGADVQPGQTLYLEVGGAGTQPNAGYNGGGAGGLNNGQLDNSAGGGGGGASDVRSEDASVPVSQTDSRLIVGGGGGGGAGCTDGKHNPADGGAADHDAPAVCSNPGGGATTTSGGRSSGNWSSTDGTIGQGGAGGRIGGGGGGGRYGGGGGGLFGGGGGGSTWTSSADGTTGLAAQQGDGSIVIAYVPPAQQVSFDSTPSAPAVGGDYAPSASGGASGNPVTYSVDPATTGFGTSNGATCTLDASGTTVAFAHVGTCVVDATQAPGDGYGRGTAQQSFTVDQGAQSISFAPLSSPARIGTPQPLSASSTSGGTVEFSVDPTTTGYGTATPACAVSSDSVSFAAVGTCVIDADQSGDDDYLAADTAPQQVDVVHPTAVSVALTHATAPFGQSLAATATVSGTTAGTVQFDVAGTPVGDPVDVGTDGTATSPPLTDPSGQPLSPGNYPVGATFTPSDPTYGSSQADPRTLSIGSADTNTTTSMTPSQLTATVGVVAPGAGSPGGQVTFVVNGVTVGSAPVDNGVATLDRTTTPGAVVTVTATYSGDDDFTGSTATFVRQNPTVTARLSSTHARTHYGWYRGAVTVTFTCTAHGATLVGACPAPARFATDDAHQSISRTVSAVDGGRTTVSVSGINVDSHAPYLRIGNVVANGHYRTAPKAVCVAKDSLSGIASCRITHRTSGHRETFTAVATDKAGNVTEKTTTVTLD